MIETRSSIFYYLININIQMETPVCDSGQYICVTGLHNFFFVPQDLIDRTNSYFQRIVFQRNLLLIGFQHSKPHAFPTNISSLHWNGAACTCKEEL